MWAAVGGGLGRTAGAADLQQQTQCLLYSKQRGPQLHKTVQLRACPRTCRVPRRVNDDHAVRGSEGQAQAAHLHAREWRIAAVTGQHRVWVMVGPVPQAPGACRYDCLQFAGQPQGCPACPPSSVRNLCVPRLCAGAAPLPPPHTHTRTHTCDVSRNTGTVLAGSWKRLTSRCRASALATLPSMRQCGMPSDVTPAWWVGAVGQPRQRLVCADHAVRGGWLAIMLGSLYF